MQPVHTRSELAAADEAAAAGDGLERLVAQAGFATARAAIELLGSAYGRRVVAVCGKGHNGDDGRVASRLLRSRGMLVSEVEARPGLRRLPACDLVIDAAFGTGLRGSYDAPLAGDGVPVLAIDLPSGLDADTGEASDGAVRATRTVTMAAFKQGLLLGRGPELSGRIEIAAIDLPLGPASAHVVEDGDVTALVPERATDSNKWQCALAVVAGSPGMAGAGRLVAEAALRAGSGMVRLCMPGVAPGDLPATEAVGVPTAAGEFARQVLDEVSRCRALVVGPGIGRRDEVGASVRELLVGAAVPAVVDADGLFALGGADAAAELVSSRSAATVLTPHDGEWRRLLGSLPPPDRVGAVRSVAERTGAVVLLKGPATVVAEPGGEVLIVTSGNSRLATAGTGDVLAGIIGALLARGLSPLLAAGLGAHVHGRAASLAPSQGLVAGDLPTLVASVLSALADGRADLLPAVKWTRRP